LNAGDSQYTSTELGEAAAPVTVRGGSGTVRGTIGDDAALGSESPAALRATTVNV
jgi:hypothetical protein